MSAIFVNIRTFLVWLIAATTPAAQPVLVSHGKRKKFSSTIPHANIILAKLTPYS